MKKVTCAMMLFLTTPALAGNFDGAYVAGGIGYVFGSNDGEERFATTGKTNGGETINLSDFDWAASAGYTGRLVMALLRDQKQLSI